MTYYLQTWDTTHEIDEQQHEAIMDLSTNGEAKGLWLGKSYIAFSSIRSITPKKEEGNTGLSWDEIKQLGSGMEGIINRATVNGRKAIIAGLQRAITRKQALGEPTPKAEALLKQMQQGKLGRIVHEFNPNVESWEGYNARIAVLNAELA